MILDFYNAIVYNLYSLPTGRVYKHDRHKDGSNMEKNGTSHKFKEKLTKDAINTLPLYHYSGSVKIVQDREQLEEAHAHLMQQKVLGFDTETRPTFKKGKLFNPSLVQLASSSEVYIFHLEWLSLQPLLIDILVAPSIIKTGVAVQDDLKGLAKITPFVPCNFIDLSTVGKKHGIGNLGLRGLAAQFMNVRISKSEQCSNWAHKELTEKQVRYAATDAWVSREIFVCMQKNGFIA